MNSQPHSHRNWIQYLPGAARLALKPIPGQLLELALGAGLNRSFRPCILRGDMEFLQSRWAMVQIPDIALNFRVTLVNTRLVVDTNSPQQDVCFKSNLNDLLQIIAGKVDPDTLFFRRRLLITGDTELGLALKNFLDSIDPRSLMHAQAFKILCRLAAHEENV